MTTNRYGPLFLIPLVVSVVAAGFSGAQWYEAREQRLLANRPQIDFSYENDASEAIVGLQLINVGTGPALIKGIKFFVDRKPVKDADEALSYGKLNEQLVGGVDLDDEAIIGASEKVWLFNRTTRNKRDWISSWTL